MHTHTCEHAAHTHMHACANTHTYTCMHARTHTNTESREVWAQWPPTWFLAEPVQEGLARVTGVFKGQLQEGARLLPLLHEPHACDNHHQALYTPTLTPQTMVISLSLSHTHTRTKLCTLQNINKKSSTVPMLKIVNMVLNIHRNHKAY